MPIDVVPRCPEWYAFFRLGWYPIKSIARLLPNPQLILSQFPTDKIRTVHPPAPFQSCASSLPSTKMASTTPQLLPSMAVLDVKHGLTLKSAFGRLLTTHIAESTFAEILDGLPTTASFVDFHGHKDESLVFELFHSTICPGAIEKMRTARSAWDPLAMNLPHWVRSSVVVLYMSLSLTPAAACGLRFSWPSSAQLPARSSLSCVSLNSWLWLVTALLPTSTNLTAATTSRRSFAHGWLATERVGGFEGLPANRRRFITAAIRPIRNTPVGLRTWWDTGLRPGSLAASWCLTAEMLGTR